MYLLALFCVLCGQYAQRALPDRAVFLLMCSMIFGFMAPPMFLAFVPVGYHGLLHCHCACCVVLCTGHPWCTTCHVWTCVWTLCTGSLLLSLAVPPLCPSPPLCTGAHMSCTSVAVCSCGCVHPSPSHHQLLMIDVFVFGEFVFGASTLVAPALAV